MRIESISETKDRAGRYWVKLSGGKTLKLYPQTLSELNLCTGRELTENDLAVLEQNAGRVSAKMRAVRIVSASAVSTRDLEDRLRRKGENPEDARAAVEWMQELSFVDDLQTAKQLVRRGVAKGYGINRLRQILYEKQIPRELWEAALEDLPSPDEEIIRYLDRYLPPEPEPKELKKIMDALIRRGYCWSDIRRCLLRRGQSFEQEPEE